MKKVKCAHPDCANRRIHWTDQETARTHQLVEVPDDFDEATDHAYCSLTCRAYHQARNIWTDEPAMFRVYRVNVRTGVALPVDGIEPKPKLEANAIAQDLLMNDRLHSRGGWRYEARRDAPVV